MNIVKKYNALNGAEMTRAEIASMLEKAELEEQPIIARKLRSVLEENDDETFEITVENPQIEALPASFLSGIDFMAMPEDENLGLGKPVSPSEIYKMVSEKLIAEIEKGGKSQKRWNEEGYLIAYNYVSQKAYRSINQTILGPNPFIGERLLENPYFLTFKQVEKLGGKVKKGEKGNEVTYYSFLYSYEKDGLKISTYNEAKAKKEVWANLEKIHLYKSTTDKEKRVRLIMDYISIAFLKYYHVFNGSQITGIDFDLDNFKLKGKITAEKKKFEKQEVPELIISHYPKPAPPIEYKGNSAHYMPSKDNIKIPPMEQFNSIELFYSTIFHELIHSTGAKKRLNREKGRRFGDEKYSFEELIAEIGAAFLSAESGLLPQTIQENAAYLKGWHLALIELMKEDNKAIFRASSKAQKAADFILNRDKEGVPAYQKELGKKLVEKPKKEAEKVAEKPTKFILNDLPKKYEKRIYESSIAELKGAAQVEDKILRTAAQNMVDLLDQKLFVLLNFKNGYGRNADRAAHRNVPTVYRKLLKKDLSKIGSVEVLKFLLEKFKEYKYETAWESYGFQGKNAHEINKIVNFNIRSIEKFLGDGKPPKKAKEEPTKPVEKPRKTVKDNPKPFANKPKSVAVSTAIKDVLGLPKFKNSSNAIQAAIIWKHFKDIPTPESEVELFSNYEIGIMEKSSKLHFGFGHDENQIIELTHLGDEFVEAVRNRLESLKNQKHNYSFFDGLAGPKQIKIDTEKFKNMSVPDLRKFTFDYYNQKLKKKDNVFIKNRLQKVDFIGDGARKILKPMYSAKAAVIEHLEELIKNSTYNNFGERKSNDPPNIIGYLNFKSKLIVDGDKRHVRVSLRLDRDRTTKFKSYEVGKKQKQVKPARAAVANPKDGQVKPVLNHKDNKKTAKSKKTNKKGLAMPEPAPETLHKVTQPYTKPERNKKIRSIGAQSETKSDFFNVPGEVGKFFQVIERKPVHSVVITLDGHQGGGKTTFLYQIMNAFATGQNRGIFLSLEEHPESHLAKQKADKYITPQNREYLDTIGDLDNFAELYDLIADYDIIYIDSWQKLQRIVGNIRLDEDLRKKFDGKVFVIIFQQTTTGRTKGGSEVVFDGDIITKLVKEPKFEDNYAYFDKNRYTRIPLEAIRYNIAQGKTYNPEGEETEPETVPAQTGNFGSLNVTALD